MNTFKKNLLALSLGSLVATSALAQDQQAVQKPYEKANNSWISISGKVTSAAADTFVLDYGNGVITVEMDDWDWYREGYKMLSGDDVVVYGRIDDDIFEVAKIEAQSVYVKGLNSYFRANDADEEDLVFSVNPVAATTVVQGTVVSIDGRDINVSAGGSTLSVDTATMPYNPLDKQGYQQIEVGDRISAVGVMEPSFFADRELKADAVTTLSGDKGTSNKTSDSKDLSKAGDQDEAST
ncbi:hypothetical protein ACX0MV_06365 [Pseudomonas borbori]